MVWWIDIESLSQEQSCGGLLFVFIADYCHEYKIQQRILFEAALIEFFQKYGFKRVVEQ